MSVSGVKSTVIGLAVALLACAILLPIAITQIVNANTTGWGAQDILVWGVLPTAVIVAVLLKVFDAI